MDPKTENYCPNTLRFFAALKTEKYINKYRISDIGYPISIGWRHQMNGCNCCVDEEMSGRRFLTNDEKREQLETYKKWLDSESKGVAEAISKLKKAR